MVQIGFSTGCLYPAGISTAQSIKYIQDTDTKIIELCCFDHKELLRLRIDRLAQSLRRFDNISVHASAKITLAPVVKKLKMMDKKLGIGGIVIHPCDIEDFEWLASIDLPILLENMDHHKKSGRTPQEFKEFRKKYDFGFVLDIQHVYNNDPTMKLVEEFKSVMGKKLQHLHVSGCTKELNHAPTYLADNKDAIMKIRMNKPVILEGGMTRTDQLQKELDFVKARIK